MSLLSTNLYTFMKIVEAKTIHGAASTLKISQTGVTQRLRSIERELEVNLFTRSRKGMSLTQEGIALYNYCLRAVELEGETLAVLKKSGVETNATITIVGPTSTLVSRSIEQCEPLYQKWPLLNINFVFDDSADLLSYIKHGKAEIAIVPHHLVPNELDSKVIRPESFCLVCSSKWKKRKLKKILNEERIIDFYEDDNTTIDYLKKFSLLSYVERNRIFVNNNKSLIDLVLAGVGYATLSKEIAIPYVQKNSMVMLNSSRSYDHDLAICWYPRPEPPPYFKDIINSLK